MNERLIIIGASGHGRVVADIAKLNGYNHIVFLDDDRSVMQCEKYGVIGLSDDAEKIDGSVFIAIGDSVVRQKLCERYMKRLVSLVHPDAVVATDVEVDLGTVIMAGVVINPGSRVGKGCIINTSSSIDHDCLVNDYCHIAVGAHLSGTVRIGSGTWIGIGAVVSNNVNICSGCMIGAGAVVIRDIDEVGTYVGIPAKEIKHAEP